MSNDNNLVRTSSSSLVTSTSESEVCNSGRRTTEEVEKYFSGPALGVLVEEGPISFILLEDGVTRLETES